MAIPEHVEMLKKGAKVWNEWRQEVMISWVNLIGADFTGAKLSGVNLSDANLHNTRFDNAYLNEADFSGSLIIEASFIGARFDAADFFHTFITDTNLAETYLDYAHFQGAYLKNVNFSEVNMQGTIFSNIDLSDVKNLETVTHGGPSTIGIDTIYKSRGNIPEKFLRGCGVPEDFITYMRSLTGKAIGFYSCFISFTEADDTFSERLYNDMQAANVRCWRWKEDAKWGRTLMRSIDEAVRVYDKLVVICSEQSLKSPAVVREIERALQKEDELARAGQEGEVLFPIRLDDYIFSGWQHHRKADVVAKNVGDFREWKEPEVYKKALGRLLRDLKAEARGGVA